MIKTTIPLLRGKQEREFVACEHSWGVNTLCQRSHTQIPDKILFMHYSLRKQSIPSYIVSDLLYKL